MNETKDDGPLMTEAEFQASWRSRKFSKNKDVNTLARCFWLLMRVPRASRRATLHWLLDQFKDDLR